MVVALVTVSRYATVQCTARRTCGMLQLCACARTDITPLRSSRWTTDSPSVAEEPVFDLQEAATAV